MSIPAAAMTPPARPQLVVIDPAAHTPELECFNHLAQMSPMAVSYHLPALFGMGSLLALEALPPASLRGIIVLGSASSVNERKPWQIALEAWLAPRLDAGVPTLGFCYGHQMLAAMFGGRVDYLFPDQHKLKGFRRVDFDASPLGPARSGDLVVSHCEAVVTAPAALQVFGRSDETPVDALRHRTLPIFSLQAHPEATAPFLAGRDIPPTDPRRLAFGYSIVAGFLRLVAGAPYKPLT